MKTLSEKKLWLKALVNSGFTYTAIDKQLVRKERIETEPIDRSFEVFNTNRTKNREVMKFTPLKLEINGHIERIDAVVINLNNTDMFLRYHWLVKHNLEVNWDKETIWFTKHPREYKTQY